MREDQSRYQSARKEQEAGQEGSKATSAKMINERDQSKEQGAGANTHDVAENDLMPRVARVEQPHHE